MVKQCKLVVDRIWRIFCLCCGNVPLALFPNNSLIGLLKLVLHYQYNILHEKTTINSYYYKNIHEPFFFIANMSQTNPRLSVESVTDSQSRVPAFKSNMSFRTFGSTSPCIKRHLIHPSYQYMMKKIGRPHGYAFPSISLDNRISYIN